MDLSFTPEEQRFREEVRSFLDSSLPPDLRLPLVLCDLQGLPSEELAGVLGIPLGTVKSRINRARVELAKRLVGRHRRPD